MSLRISYHIFIFACFLASCSTSDPKIMAKDFCDCMKKSTDYQECEELAKAQKERIGNDKDKLQIYADEVLNCTNVSD